MDLTMLFKRVGKVAADNTPALLTALGVSGTLTTAYLAAKGAFKAKEALDEATADISTTEEAEKLQTFQGKAEVTWKYYVPAATSAALTISAIILASRVQERRTAALAAAYTTLEKSYTEYRAKNVEALGKKKEQELRDKIAQQQVDDNPVGKSTLIVSGKGETLCRDAWSGRYFNSSKNLVDAAVNDFNQNVLKQGYGSLTEFWSYLGLPGTDESDYIGWNSDDKLLELDFSGVVDDNGEPALSFSFRTTPDPRFQSAF